MPCYFSHHGRSHCVFRFSDRNFQLVANIRGHDVTIRTWPHDQYRILNYHYPDDLPNSPRKRRGKHRNSDDDALIDVEAEAEEEDIDGSLTAPFTFVVFDIRTSEEIRCRADDFAQFDDCITQFNIHNVEIVMCEITDEEEESGKQNPPVLSPVEDDLSTVATATDNQSTLVDYRAQLRKVSELPKLERDAAIKPEDVRESFVPRPIPHRRESKAAPVNSLPLSPPQPESEKERETDEALYMSSDSSSSRPPSIRLHSETRASDIDTHSVHDQDVSEGGDPALYMTRERERDRESDVDLLSPISDITLFTPLPVRETDSEGGTVTEVLLDSGGTNTTSNSTSDSNSSNSNTTDSTKTEDTTVVPTVVSAVVSIDERESSLPPSRSLSRSLSPSISDSPPPPPPTSTSTPTAVKPSTTSTPSATVSPTPSAKIDFNKLKAGLKTPTRALSPAPTASVSASVTVANPSLSPSVEGSGKSLPAVLKRHSMYAAISPSPSTAVQATPPPVPPKTPSTSDAQGVQQQGVSSIPLLSPVTKTLSSSSGGTGSVSTGKKKRLSLDSDTLLSNTSYLDTTYQGDVDLLLDHNPSNPHKIALNCVLEILHKSSDDSYTAKMDFGNLNDSPFAMALKRFKVNVPCAFVPSQCTFDNTKRIFTVRGREKTSPPTVYTFRVADEHTYGLWQQALSLSSTSVESIPPSESLSLFRTVYTGNLDVHLEQGITQSAVLEFNVLERRATLTAGNRRRSIIVGSCSFPSSSLSLSIDQNTTGPSSPWLSRNLSLKFALYAVEKEIIEEERETNESAVISTTESTDSVNSTTSVREIASVFRRVSVFGSPSPPPPVVMEPVVAAEEDEIEGFVVSASNLYYLEQWRHILQTIAGISIE